MGFSLFCLIALGVGVNFPIFILDRLRSDFAQSQGVSDAIVHDAFARTGRPLFFTAMVVAVGFLLLCISEFRTLVQFGLLIGTCMLVSFLATVTLLPALLAAWRPRFVWGKVQSRRDDRV